MREERAEADGQAHGVGPPLRCSPHDIRARRRADGRRREAMGEASFQFVALEGLGVAVRPAWKSKFYGAFVLNHRIVLHAIDETPARWRGDAGSSPLDRASTAASSREIFDFHTASDGLKVT